MTVKRRDLLGVRVDDPDQDHVEFGAHDHTTA